MSPEERIAELEALVAQQTEQIAQLLARNRELEAQLAKARRDSHTSSKPPSSDGLRRKTRSLRKPSGKKAGGQLGHHGETLRLQAAPDVVIEHRPAVCTQCQALLTDAPVIVRERRQVQDLPLGQLVGRCRGLLAELQFRSLPPPPPSPSPHSQRILVHSRLQSSTPSEPLHSWLER